LHKGPKSYLSSPEDLEKWHPLNSITAKKKRSLNQDIPIPHPHQDAMLNITLVFKTNLFTMKIWMNLKTKLCLASIFLAFFT
jgi:hypothetical protein